MGNQISLTKRRKPVENKSATASFTTRTFTDSFNGNGSTVSSSQPKFTSELYPGTLTEANRQQGEHYLLKHLFQISYFAPIDDVLAKPGSAALDIACGPHASWILDVANDFPDCTFYGFDIIEPFSVAEGSSDHIPDNCKLQQLDIFDGGLNYPDNTFDFVHQRMVHLVYQQDKVQWLLSEVLRVTKDDGWIEFVEPDVIPKRAGPIFGKLTRGGSYKCYMLCIEEQYIHFMIYLVQSYVKDRLGSLFEGYKLTSVMKEAGLVDIKSDYGSLPVCWGGYVGKLVYEVYINHLLIYNYLY
jgi:ubiquinone/menaquinone biosynthesis C-methylase UbiE